MIDESELFELIKLAFLVGHQYPHQMNRHPSEIIMAGIHIEQPKLQEFRFCDSCERMSGSYHSVTPTPIERDDKRFDAWNAYLPGWSMAYPWRLEMRPVKQELGDGYYLRIEFRYPDERDSRDGVSPVAAGLGLWPPSWLPDEHTPRWIRANLQYHIGHELDEHLTFNGERPFDPHHQSHHQCDACIARERLIDMTRDRGATSSGESDE